MILHIWRLCNILLVSFLLLSQLRLLHAKPVFVNTLCEETTIVERVFPDQTRPPNKSINKSSFSRQQCRRWVPDPTEQSARGETHLDILLRLASCSLPQCMGFVSWRSFFHHSSMKYRALPGIVLSEKTHTVLPRIEPPGLYLILRVQSGDSIRGGGGLFEGGLINYLNVCFFTLLSGEIFPLLLIKHFSL